MEHDLPGILDGADEPVTVEELEAVVRRAGQRRRATIVAGAAALLAMGALGGAIGRGATDGRRTGLAAGEQAEPAPAPPSKVADAVAMGMAAPGFGQGLTFTSIFRRDAHGVAIRGYRVTPPKEAQGTAAACQYKPDIIHAGLSNTAAVGTVAVPSLRSQPASDAQLRLNGFGAFGIDEGQPATWVAVEVDATVATVRLTAGGATDAMAPADGAAVLVVPGVTKEGTVEALRADGSVASSKSLAQPDSWTPDPACAPQACVKGVPAPAGDAATTLEAGAGEVKPAIAQDLPCFSESCAIASAGSVPALRPDQEPAKDPAATATATATVTATATATAPATAPGATGGSGAGVAGTSGSVTCASPAMPPKPGMPVPDGPATAATGAAPANAAP